MVRSTLKDFVEHIDQKIFLRIHRSYSVNINLIDYIFPAELSIQGFKVPIGKSYKEALYKALGIQER